MYDSYTYLMYGKYSLFYESHKNLGYYPHAQTVSTRPLFGGEWPGNEARVRPSQTVPLNWIL